MEKRYQVFLSSTYVDLQEERLEVVRALLELDCIPSGMEYFPAANDDQWSFIQELIDQCDYYIVIIGSRYGSVSTDGLSFTEKEYRYAIEKGIPVIGFVHAQPDSIPQGKSELNPDARIKLTEFRNLVRAKLCKEWSSPAELGAVVSRSLTQLIKRNPRPGWVRANHLASAEASEEILRLRQIIDKKDLELGKQVFARAASVELLAQGNDYVELSYTVSLFDHTLPYSDSERNHRHTSKLKLTWDEIYKSFAPHLMTLTKISEIKSGINKLIREREMDYVLDMNRTLKSSSAVTGFIVSDSSLQMVIIQFTALGFLEFLSTEDKEGKIVKQVKLSPSGHQYLINTSAIKRSALHHTP